MFNRERSFYLGNPSDSFSEFSTSAEKPISKGRRRDEEEEPESPKEHPGWILEPEESPKKGRKETIEKSKSNESDEDPRLEDFKCPISMEIMRDPHVAADGFTYEAEEFRKWLRSGGRTSPKTNKPLENHNLVPNHTLRIIIKDWLEKNPNYKR